MYTIKRRPCLSYGSGLSFSCNRGRYFLNKRMGDIIGEQQNREQKKQIDP